MLTIGSQASLTRRAAGLFGCLLASLGLLVMHLRLGVADPLVTSLAVCVAVWLAWVVAGFASAPLRVAQGSAGRELQPTAHELLAPEFVDTQITWMSPAQDAVDAADLPAQSRHPVPGHEGKRSGLALDADKAL